MSNFEILKGTRDFEPEEQIIVEELLKIIRKNFERYGFRPFDSPIIEMMDTLTYKYENDAEIVGEIFKLTDRGNRKLGLRYDLTTPLARYVASKKQLKLPFKRYQIGKVFRDGPIKRGRLREFIQCDADIIGIGNIEVEAELLILFFKTFRDLGINSIIELNNNKILRGALLQENFKEKELSSIILSIDKLKKIGLDGVLEEIKKKGFDVNRVKKSLDILSSSSFGEIKRKAKNLLLKEGIEELEKLTELIGNFVKFRINFSMSRGLDIYTGNIWEAYDLDGRINSSIGSGGRYDNVIGEYCNSKDKIPSLGISFGIIPILSVLSSKNKSKIKKTPTDLLIVPLGKELFLDALNLAEKIRDNGLNLSDLNEGLNVEIDYRNKLKKAFDYCDFFKIKYLIVLGRKDVENRKFVLKNLKTKEEKEFKLKND